MNVTLTPQTQRRLAIGLMIAIVPCVCFSIAWMVLEARPYNFSADGCSMTRPEVPGWVVVGVIASWGTLWSLLAPVLIAGFVNRLHTKGQHDDHL